VSRAGSAFDADGNLKDEAAVANLREFVQGFARYVAQSKPD
jgi:hypothetical protein